MPADFVYTQNDAAATTQFDGVFNDTSSTGVLINNIDGSMIVNGTINASITNDSNLISSGIINGATVTNNANGLMTLDGETVADISNNGDLIVNGTVTGDVTNNGILSGSGVVTGTVTNGGEFNPGNSPGTFTINGDLDLLASSVLNIEITGLVQGIEYDELIVTGNINFDGQLNIIVDNSAGYVASLQDSFDPISYNTASGDIVVTASRGYAYDLTIDSSKVNLLTVTVPGSELSVSNAVAATQSDVVTLIATTQDVTNVESADDVEAELASSEDDSEGEEGGSLVCS